MTAYVAKAGNTNESAYIKPYLDSLENSGSNELGIRMVWKVVNVGAAISDDEAADPANND